jgi:RNA polymerase sigma-70 factor (ECF subfamily)
MTTPIPATSPAVEADPEDPMPATGSLVRRAAAGDHSAFERLVHLHERRVFGVAWRLLGDSGEAEDAAQEAFLRLYRALGRIDPKRPLTPYLDRITVNVCRTLGRTRARRREQSIESGRALDGAPDRLHSGTTAIDPEDPRSDPAADAGLSEVRRLAAAALGELPFKQRAALVLRELHGLSTREVARALNSSETSVRSHVCRARLALRERLAALRGRAGTPRREEEP